MSLLLDALKKAADDKKKASQIDASGKLTLDDISAIDATDKPTTDTTTDALTLESIEQPDVVDAEDKAVVQESHKKPEAPTATDYTVSDEALSMLIDKTNRDEKKNKRQMLISVLLVSLFILIISGFYYYTDMQTEIAGLERKHQISMQAMRSKTNNGSLREESKIIHKLVSDLNTNDKVVYAKKQMAQKKNVQKIKKRQVKVKNNIINTSPAVLFQKTNKVDPVSETLEQAWLAYDSGQYDTANKLYKKVLNIEKNNRDALLGLGAIAVIEKNNVMAKSVYLSLLESDPRDSIAIAALANLKNSDVATKADENHLLNMLQKNPGDAHLSFALGNVYAQQNQWKLAQQAYFSAWQVDAENPDYLFNLAVSMDQIGKQKQAAVFYRDSLIKADNKQVSFSREAVQKRINELSGL